MTMKIPEGVFMCEQNEVRSETFSELLEDFTCKNVMAQVVLVKL